MTLTTAARALALSQSGEDCFDALEEAAQELAREHVRAVLRAVREPTPGMVLAGIEDVTVPDPLSGKTGKDCWRSMIDTLLAE